MKLNDIFKNTTYDMTIFNDLIEYDPTELVASDKSILELDEISGGTVCFILRGSV